MSEANWLPGHLISMQDPAFAAPVSEAAPHGPRCRDDVREEIRKRGSNINTDSLLATDYLNHFNEIVMLFDLAADMPDCFQDAAAWQPLSYQEHFTRSNLSDKDLAIEAYGHSPDDIRARFDRTVAELDAFLLDGIERCLVILEHEGSERFRLACSEAAAESRGYIDRLSAVIHGTDGHVAQQSGFDTETLAEAQETIDSLFDA